MLRPRRTDRQRFLALDACSTCRPTTTELPTGASPDNLPAGAVEVRNDYGESGYGGAAPPAGDIPHRYVYTVFAVDVEELDIPAEASPAYVGFNLTFHTLARAAIRPTFQVEG